MTPSELKRLLLLVKPGRSSKIEGLDAFRNLLRADTTGRVLDFLKREIQRTEGEVQGGLAFVIAEHHCEKGDLTSLQCLFAAGDAQMKEAVLNGLWGRPGPTPGMAEGIVAMAIGAIEHPNAAVRAQACSVLQNQSGWKVDVLAAIAPLVRLLADPEARVRQAAACALGNLAKRNYALSSAIPQLRRNLKRREAWVRKYSAWAVWQLSRKHDIAAAVPELISVLATTGDDDDAQKQAAGALLHHARKSPENLADLRKSIENAPLDHKKNAIAKFCRKLSEI